MDVVNRSSHPTAEVDRVVLAGWTGRERPRVRDLWRKRGPTIVVHRRVSHADDREGFTPFGHAGPVDLWVEDSNRYPQPGARDWRQELLMSAAHEHYHYLHNEAPGSCRHDACEVAAEAAARRASARLRL